MAKGNGSINAADSFADLRYREGLTTISRALPTERSLVYSTAPLNAGSTVALQFTGLNLPGQDFREQTTEEINTHTHPGYCWAWAITADQAYVWTFGPYSVGWHQMSNLSLAWIQEENPFPMGSLTALSPTEEITMSFIFEIRQPSGMPHTTFTISSLTLGSRVISDQEYAAEFAATWFPITLNFGWPPTFLPTFGIESNNLNVKAVYTMPGGQGINRGLSYTALAIA